MKTKEELLKDAGYRYDFNRLAYINRSIRKVIDVDWVRDHSDQELGDELVEGNDSGEWQFCFDRPLSDSVISTFISEIDGRHAAH